MRFWRRRPVRRITLYGKPGCHLCEEARAQLDRLPGRYRLVVQEVDITQDPQLFRRYDILIPVIVVDGKTEITAPISQAELRRALDRD